MPLLSFDYVQELLDLAQVHRRCGECGWHAAYDYCRTCDEFFWHHAPGCTMFAWERNGHYGHRTHLTPFVEA